MIWINKRMSVIPENSGIHSSVILAKAGIHSINRPTSFSPSPSKGERRAYPAFHAGGGGDNNYSKQSLPLLRTLISILFLSITVLGFSNQAFSEETVSIKSYDLSFAVSPDWVKAKLNKTSKPIIVDVRRSEEFEKYRIPQSINLPLYAIKTKLFLRNKHIILVNKGFAYSELEEEAQRLKQSGFVVSILYGGLNAWQKNNGELSGDVFAREDLDYASAQSLYREKEYSNIKIIDVSKKPIENSSNGLNKIHVSRENLAGYLSKYHSKIKKASQKNTDEVETLLIVNDSGSGYERIKQIVQKAKIQNVFYLTGGLHAYKQHIENVSLAMAPIEDRLVTKGACDSCVK